MRTFLPAALQPADLPTLEQAFQDQLIENRLPAWLRAANPGQLSALVDALKLSQYFRERVNALLAGIQGLDRFARARLEQALAEQQGEPFDSQHWALLAGQRQPLINSQPVGAHLTEVVYRQVPLLEVALRNFTEAETLDGGQPKGNRLMNARVPLAKPLTAAHFATLCRTLDLGAAYQRHLDDHLRPAEGRPDDSANPASLMARAYRYSMLADAHVAGLKGVLNDSELQMISRLCLLHQPLQLGNRPVIARRLKLLGVELQQVVVLDVQEQGVLRTTSARVLVYIPGDAQGAWHAYPDLRHFANALGKRLRTPSYQRFFNRFIRRRDSQAFFAAVQGGYAGVSDLANIALDEHMSDYAQPLFTRLAEARIEQIKDDAAMLAVPTASVDREVQRLHDQRLAAEGWGLLNVAGFFVPLLGVALLTVSAVELLGEVYHGAKAWREGDSSEALEHLLNVASDLALMAVTAAGVTLARGRWTRSRWVDSLVPAYLEDGTVRLSSTQLLEGYRQAPPATAQLDGEGILRDGDRAWVAMDGEHYPVIQRARDGRWQLRAHQGHAPQLCHNGAGAWRLWYEQPATWPNTQGLFNRLGMAFAQLQPERVGQVLLTLGLDADHLRALHVNLRAPGAELSDSVARALLDQRIDQVIAALDDDLPVTDTLLQHWAQPLQGTAGLPPRSLAEYIRVQRPQLFQLSYDALQLPDTPAAATLRRQFPSLHGPGAAELLASASAADRRLLETGRVPLRLGEAARRMVRRIRVARAVEGIVVQAPQQADLARLVLALGNQQPGWAEGRRWRLLEGSLQGLVLASHGGAESAEAFDLVHLGGRFQLHDRQGSTLGEPGELFEVLAQGLDETRRERLGIARASGPGLRQWLQQCLAQRRGEVEQLLALHTPTTGWWQAPQRLGDGRIGYPLSGRGTRRGRPAGLFAVVRMLYPGFNDAQVMAWVNDVHDSGRSVESTVARLARELEALDTQLHGWVRRSSNDAQRAERRYFRQTLTNCWQRRASSGALHPDLPDGYRLSVWAVDLGSLPSLPAQVSFAHVRELSLLDMNLTGLPADFLSAFPNLETLELSNNHLTRLPPGLMQMPRLTRLDLYRNAVVLDAEQATMLGNCEHLEYLNLSHNPLGRVFPLYRLDRLRRLHLRGTGIDSFPAGLLDRLELLVADLRDNQISQLPRHFYRSPIWISSSVMLENNPLAPQEAERLQIFMQANAIPELAAVPDEGSSASRSLWLDAAANSERGQQSASWDEVDAMRGSGDFFNMLQLLQASAEFQQRPQALGNRVFAMMNAMVQHPSLAEELLSQATETLHCQDGAALCFSNLELHMLVWRARVDAQRGDSQAALLRLGRQLWRLDRLDQVVVADIQARRAGGGDPDQVEVGLAYRLALRDEFDLPAQPGDMLFAAVAGVDERRIAQARRSLLADETAQTLADSLVTRTFWQEHLLAANRERFDALDGPFHERLEALPHEVEDSHEADYAQRMNSIRDEREQARRNLMGELTLPLVREAAGQSSGPGTLV
ncbi:hypothetical protein F3J45_01545 [Pantoea sp. Ap-967]|uniref:NEL-type E3 ubiquitin ligase domain-containing protein n=1 Tax=Pantoea sp. Ap-967 TaxID=2608362 RepID=UPI0014210A81|nr:NEL-type E3 ubiquitin ligase domain-containing protein [Pantoea sp. Ap-967]NIE73149.1 hypothetical protein [Pantoea sp. Ap-967]